MVHSKTPGGQQVCRVHVNLASISADGLPPYVFEQPSEKFLKEQEQSPSIDHLKPGT